MKITPVIGIYLAWSLSTLGFQVLGRIVPEPARVGFEYVTILGLTGCLAWMTRIYQTGIEPDIGKNTTRRLYWAGALALIFVILYLPVARAGVKSNTITSLSTATLVLLSCLGGHWLAIHIKRPAELIPIGLVVALSDIFSVHSGPTRSFAEDITDYYREGMTGQIPLVDFFLVKMPMAGCNDFMPVFGITDWVIVALLSAGALRFNLNDNVFSLARSKQGQSSTGIFFPVAGIGLLLSIIAARSFNLYLPALPFIVMVFLITMALKYPEVRKIRGEEIRAIIFACALIGALMVVFAVLKSS